MESHQSKKTKPTQIKIAYSYSEDINNSTVLNLSINQSQFVEEAAYWAGNAIALVAERCFGVLVSDSLHGLMSLKCFPSALSFVTKVNKEQCTKILKEKTELDLWGIPILLTEEFKIDMKAIAKDLG